jgi:hypothetical protein
MNTLQGKTALIKDSSEEEDVVGADGGLLSSHPITLRRQGGA